MKVNFSESFFKSLKVLENSQKWWRKEFYREKFYHIKWGLWSLKKFGKIIFNDVRPWDYSGTLYFMREHLAQLLKTIRTKKPFCECDETRIPKEKDLEKAILLIDNIIKENQQERCGISYNNDLEFEECENMKGFYKLVGNEKGDYEKIKKAQQLYKDEWNELWDIIKKGENGMHGLNSWWY